jgi:hypothetical protein
MILPLQAHGTNRTVSMPPRTSGIQASAVGTIGLLGKADRGALCFAACTCCATPSPIQPECCGVCAACKFCDLTGWCATPATPIATPFLA